MDTQPLLGLSIFAAAFSWTLCVVWYSIRAKWWKNAYGINTWLVSFTIALTFLILSAVFLFPAVVPAWLLYGVTVGIYFLLAFAGLQRFHLIRKAQNEGEAENYHRRVTDLK